MIEHRATAPTRSSTRKYEYGISRISVTAPSVPRKRRNARKTEPTGATAPTGFAGWIAPPCTWNVTPPALRLADVGHRLEQRPGQGEQAPREVEPVADLDPVDLAEPTGQDVEFAAFEDQDRPGAVRPGSPRPCRPRRRSA